jgi:hypothetical protein
MVEDVVEMGAVLGVAGAPVVSTDLLVGDDAQPAMTNIGATTATTRRDQIRRTTGWG